MSHGTHGGGKGTAVIAAVERIQQSTVLTHESHFCGGGTGIDTQITVPVVSGEISFFHGMDTVTLGKFRIFGFILKQRLHTLDLKIHLDSFGKPVAEFFDIHGHIGLAVHGSSDGGK